MTFKYFTRQEFDCQETGENEMEDEFIHALDALRQSAAYRFVLLAGSVARNIALKLRNLAGQDSTREALLLILLLLTGLSVSLSLATLLS